MLQNTLKWEHHTKQVPQVLGITQQIKRLDIVPRSSWKPLTTNDSTNDVDPIDAPKIQKLELRIKKPR